VGNGTVTIQFYVNDTLGNINFAEVTVRKDIIDPSINIVAPTPDQLFSTSEPNFIVEISDDNLDTRWYTIDGGITNITFIVNGTIDPGNWTAHSDGPVILTFYANDSAGNIASASRNINKDTTIPNMYIIAPLPDQVIGASAPSFTIEIFDLNLDTMWYRLNNGTIITINTTFAVNESIAQARWDEMGDGLVTIEFYANDTLGYFNTTQVIVNKSSDAPSINIISPISDFYFGTIPPSYTVEIFDPTLDKMWYTLDGGPNIFFIVNGTIDPGNWTAESDGPVTIFFYANDSFGNIAFDQRTVNKDTAIPSINIVSPTLNQLFGINTPNFIVEITDPILDTMWYSLDNGVTNITFAANGTFNPVEWGDLLNGTATITFYANDTVGNMASSSRVVRVDKIIPSVLINSPTDGTIWSIPPPLNITAIDENVDTIWYRVGSNTFILTNNTEEDLESLLWAALSEGVFTIEIFANDTAGNLNNTYILTLTKDTLAPVVTVTFPQENSTIGINPPQISVSISDVTLDQTWYVIVGNNRNYTFTGTEGSNIITIPQAIWEALPDGSITIIFYANDSLGRIGSDSINLIKSVPEIFGILDFLLSPPGIILMISIVGGIILIIIIRKILKTHRSTDREVERIEGLWD